MEGWSGELQALLAERLGSAGVPHEFDTDGDLVCHEADEEQVELVIDELLARAADEGMEELDGLEANDLLSALFEATDRYMIIHFSGFDTTAALATVGNYHTARVVPLLLASVAPTWVARNRPAGARAAYAAGAELIIMDDGFQNPRLKKDLSFIVIDGGFGFGNGRLIPAGPLREPIERGLRRAHAIVLIGEDTVGVLDALPPDHPPVLRAQLLPGMEAYEIRERPVVAFAGIGRPQKFFDSLLEIGCEICVSAAFPDHHPYTPDEIMPLIEQAARLEATVVTTAKDFVRLPEEARPMVKVLHIFLEWQDAGAVRALCTPLLARAGQN